MRNLFVKGLMATAAVVALASCSNDEEVTAPVVDQEVRLGVSVAIPGTKAGSSASDVNQVTDGSFSTISNVVVVPVLSNGSEEHFEAPITLGDMENTNSEKELYKNATLPSNVSAFRVYGNVPTDQTDAIAGGGFTYTPAGNADFKDSASQYYDGGNGYKTPYPLFYYGNTNPGGFYVATGEDWTAVLDWGSKTTALGENNLVKIDGVTYSVGVLAAGIRAGEDAKAKASDFVLKGIVITNQPASVNQDMERADASTVMTFAAATDATLKEQAISWNTSNTNVVTDANIYAVVMPEEAGNISVWFQFQYVGTDEFQVADGELTTDDYVYYRGSLNAKEGKQIFDAGYTTLVNAAVSDWSNGYTDVEEDTDATIGVVIDTQWKQGLSYDIEL